MPEILSLLASIGWPLAALLFGLVFIVAFFGPIRRFIERIKSAGKEGVTTLEALPSAQIAEQKKKAVEDLMRMPDSALLNELEGIIVRDLASRHLDTGTDTTKVLVRHLAATQIALEFEQVHSVIFGSQLYLLKKLNEAASAGLEPAVIDKHFDHVQKMFADQLGSWSKDDYLHFLFNRILIRTDEGKYRITVRGNDFLMWLIRMGRSENRPL
jgi:hypothetical protein